MKNAIFALVAVLAVVVASPALAEDGNVSKTTLKTLGLNDLQQMTDAEGNQVRGKLNGNGGVIGTSLISFQLLTPDSQNFINGSSVNTVIGDATFGQAGELLGKAHLVGIGPAITLDIGSWVGSVVGSIGGNGTVELQ
jgi:opacity protein-like surface antigen